jgi:hypothetical protein
MTVSIDLKPLSEETIQEMGYSSQELWLVKIGTIVFGPFETQTLKHYVHDNERLFETALASRTDESEWKPFWEHTRFQRRKPQVVDGESHDGPFWLMHAGLKIGPFTQAEVEKKIEMDLVGMSDYISIDNGTSWGKVYQISSFDRRCLSPDELPLAPTEGSFQEARVAVLEKLNEPHVNKADVAAELAFEGREAGRVIQLRMDEEIVGPSRPLVEMSSSIKWAAPSAAALLVTVAVGTYLIWGPQEESNLAGEDLGEVSSSKRFRPSKNGGSIPSPSYRLPASNNYDRPQPSSSRYPTYTETHDQFPEPQDYHVDPLDQPVNEVDQANQEHSLVSQQPTTPEENSLDAAMNGADQPRPVVEEASDF